MRWLKNNYKILIEIHDFQSNFVSNRFQFNQNSFQILLGNAERAGDWFFSHMDNLDADIEAALGGLSLNFHVFLFKIIKIASISTVFSKISQNFHLFHSLENFNFEVVNREEVGLPLQRLL